MWAASSPGAGAEHGPRQGGASAEEPEADSFPALREALKMAGGKQASGSRRRRGVRPSARLGRPTSRPQRPRPDVPAARHWQSAAGASCGGGAATQRPRFPRQCCACAPPEASDSARPRPRAPARASTPSPFRAGRSCQRGSEHRGQQRAVGTQVCSGAIGVWKMPPDGGLGLQLR